VGNVQSLNLQRRRHNGHRESRRKASSIADEKACPHGVQYTEDIDSDVSVIGQTAFVESERFIGKLVRWGDFGEH